MGDHGISGRFDEIVKKSSAERTRVRELVNEGRWREAEPDITRVKAYNTRRKARIMPRGAEAIIGSTMDLQGASFLTEGSQVRRAVAYVEVSGHNSFEIGTGFMVSPRLFLTNRHVICDKEAAYGTQITFDREMDEKGMSRPSSTFAIDPDKFFLFSVEDELDYALVAVGRMNSGSCQLGDFGFCIMSDAPDKHVIGMNTNIIQHPRGLPKMVAVRNNLLVYRTENTLLYETDTEQGSSGSPVFSDQWDLVALHHWGQPFLAKKDGSAKDIPKFVNEGVRISAIYRHLESRKAGLKDSEKEMLEEALSYAKQAIYASYGKELSPPRPHNNSSEGLELNNGGNERRLGMNNSKDINKMSIAIPLEVTLRMGDNSLNNPAAAPPAPQRSLARGAEAIRVDKDYANRGGYAPDFIPGQRLPLPVITTELSKHIAQLRPGEPNSKSGILKYEHFSIVLNKSKRMAIYTATNIDGEAYLEVDRKTGQVTAAEGETWFKDTRISESFCLDQVFYSEWSQYFDRGHLTRRSDPTWGTDEEAERGNADTFHFTNCSPQHFRFNQSSKFWQGAERYVLERGLLSSKTRKRISVFQGPIFDDSIDHLAGDVQIPSSFFKVIAWRGARGLKSVGLIVDQSQLLSETRKYLGQPQDVPVDVSQWRVSIKQIEERTGIDFGKDIKGADTVTAGAPPRVGGEAAKARRIKSFEDILAD